MWPKAWPGRWPASPPGGFGEGAAVTGRNELRAKIASVKDTQKITKAMHMVAASKLRATQERMRRTRPYRDRIAAVIARLATANPEYRHPYTVARPVAAVGLIVLSSDRGLCGGLNANLFRLASARIGEWRAAGAETRLGLVGRKAVGYFGGSSAVAAQAVDYGDRPGPDSVAGVAGALLQAFDRGEIDELWLACNRFASVVAQEPRLIRLLPVAAAELAPDRDAAGGSGDCLYEPDPKSILDGLLPRYVEALVFQGLVENVAAEQAAKMMAMQSASDNAGELIKELQSAYNRARQAAITQEIAEIVAGASAV